MSAVTLGSSIASLRAQRKLNQVSTEVASVYERLSSGLRINKASDDAAGLAISTSLDADKRVFGQGIRNFNDGLSLLNIADGAIEQLSSIVIRLKELAEQSANGTYGHTQRKALDSEAQALSKEYTRIVQSTTFNGRVLFASSFGQLSLQGGYGISGGIQSNLGGAVGTGTFGSSSSYSLPGTGDADAINTADFNNDGYLDLIEAGGVGGTGVINVSLGTGGGSFGAPVSYTMGPSRLFGSSVGDLNNDGIMDIVGTGGNFAGYGVNGFTGVRLGLGNGTFGALSTFSDTGTNSYSSTLGDLNGDGYLDLATVGANGSQGTTSIRLGRGDGTFGSASVNNALLAVYHSVELSDLNSDGLLDLVGAGMGGGDGYVTTRLGIGNGTFGTETAYATESLLSRDVAVGDITGDNIADLITSGYTDAFAGYITVRAGTGSGSFGTATSYSVTGASNTYGIRLADLNGDNFLDVGTTNFTAGPTGFVAIFLNQGNGTFAGSNSYAAEAYRSHDIVFGDFDNNGVPDYATTGTQVVSNQPTNTIRLANTTSGVQPLLPFSLASRANALQAMSQFDNALNRISSQRGQIGAFQSRIEVGIRNLQNTTDNYTAASSRIKDADIAADAANLVRTQILQQAAASVLAQANQQPALALQLLTG